MGLMWRLATNFTIGLSCLLLICAGTLMFLPEPGRYALRRKEQPLAGEEGALL